MIQETTPATEPKTKTAVGKILSEVGAVVAAPVKFAEKEFGIIAKSFKAEAPVIQSDLAAVSGALQIIKLNLSETPVVIIYLVKKAYPQFDEATILGYLQTAIKDMGMAQSVVTTDLPTTLQNIAQHLLNTSDTGWNLFWDGLFKAVSLVAVPGTTWEKILSYAVYVYQVLVKPVVK
jgi:hypothetical protein